MQGADAAEQPIEDTSSPLPSAKLAGAFHVGQVVFFLSKYRTKRIRGYVAGGRIEAGLAGIARPGGVPIGPL